ncbi:MAG: VCBS repeat-containing protein, partial [Tannerellaceae bacterium]|nr:VCBS repeat-containing protein [Tannerellaceae bacterium]
MKTLIPIRTAFLLVLMFGAIQAGAKDVYIRPGIATGSSPTVANSTETDPAPFSELRAYLLAYDASTDNKLNVYFQNGGEQNKYNVTDISTTASDRFLTFNATPGAVNELEVTFLPITPSGGGAKGVIFDGDGTTITRFIQLTGDASNPMSLSIEDVRIEYFKSNANNSSGSSSLFTIAEGSTLTLDDVVIDQIESNQLSFAYQPSGSSFAIKNSTLSNMSIGGNLTNSVISSAGVLSFENCTLDTWITQGSIILGTSGCNLSLNGCIIKNFIINSGMQVKSIIELPLSTNLEVTNCEFTNNSFFSLITSLSKGGYIVNTGGQMLMSQNTFTANTATGRGSFIRITGGVSEICFNSFYDNTIANGGLLDLADGTPVMYNNTLSGNNTSNNTNPSIIMGGVNARLINNTIYNSGNVSISNASCRVINNIVTGNGATITGMVDATTCLRNISGGIYYPTGITGGGEDITTDFNLQFNIALTGTSAGNGKAVHELINVHLSDATHAILKRGGTLSDLTGVLTDVSVLAVDQKGMERPNEISIGTIDLHNYIVTNRNIVVTFDSRYTASKTPAPITLDIVDYILTYPENITGAETSVAYSTTTLPNGILSPLPGTKVTFTPKITGGNYTGGSEPAAFDFTVSANDGSLSYTKTGSITITVVDIGLGSLPGLIEPGDFPLTCYDYMGTVTFTSSYRFITSYTGSTPPTGIQPPALNPSAQRMYGFSIPLVGDLDGDGYPEIIGTGKRDGSTSLDPYYNFLHIYNGQTGKLISRLPFDLLEGKREANRNSGYHSSPSIIALVDSDRDGKIEVIAAFPGTSTTSSGSGTFPYLNKLVSYVLTPVKSNGVTTSYTMALNPRWSGAQPQYNTGATSFQKAIPQIVDIDGDGDAEVVVYNKIYSAVTGQLKVTLETLGSTAYVGSATANAESQDGYIGFSYIYDLDLDGKYDVVAGGKVYYNIDVNAGTYSTRNFTAGTGISDGRTGVADIDGDGIPDIVVVNRASSSSLNIYVWDPGFLEIDGGGNVVRKASLTPLTLSNLKAYRSLPLAKRGTGTNSYVYIGDIDGREQVYNGKTYRLPEIAILGGTLSYTTPIHPNVAGITIANGGIPTSGHSGTSGSGHQDTGPAGALAAVTWDPSDSSLKLSFVLGHNDTSGNTGFTMFDFDNDGMMEICYRDEATMRIIKASVPCVRDNMTILSHPNIILFNRPAISYTGFEYPVIADIDNDASAEVIVIANNDDTDAYGYIYALGNGSGDKFAPALPVWNQFMYDPFKI